MELVPLPDEVELPPEDGETFADNALAKARAAHAATGMAAIADDSGIEARALGGRPGVRSARYAGPEAGDEENLELLLRELADAADRSVAYVCALAYVDEDGAEQPFEGRCEGRLADEPRGSGGFGYDPAFVPDDTGPDDARTMAELSAAEKHAISHRGRAARALAALAGGGLVIRTKSGAATLSIVSNSLLIALKIAAGAITGSIAIITEAVHSSIDLVASVVARVSVRKADEPPDPEHPYGHEKAENLAAAIEGMLILIGAGIIVFEATRRLVVGAEVENLGVGIAVIAVSAVVNLAVSAYLGRRAREHRSAALEGDAAHLRADVLTSVGVLAGLGLVEITGVDAFDSIAALVVAGAIVFAGDSHPHRLLAGAAGRGAAARGARPDRGRDRGRSAARDGRLPQAPRPPGRGPRLHRSPRAVSLGDHARARPLRGASPPGRDRGRDPRLDVLIHVEPEGAVRDPASRAAAPYRAG